MRDADASARRDPLHVVGVRLNRLDAVVHEEHLAAAIQLARDAFLDEAVVVRLDVGEHRRPVARRRLHHRHVAQAGERQMERARNRRRREREHVRLQLELLEPLLVLHAEAMLFVHDDQAELGELHVLAQQAVRADHDVDLLFLEVDEGGGLLFRVLKSAERGDAQREIGQALAERAQVLVGENRRRDENGDLPTRLHGLERGAHRDLRLAVAHVADEQPVHRPRGLHVGLHLHRRGPLVRRVLEEERRLELPLPGRVGNVCRSRGDLAARVEVEQLDRHLLNRGARLLALLRPATAPEMVQARRRGVLGDVVSGAIPLELVDTIERDIEPVAALRTRRPRPRWCSGRRRSSRYRDRSRRRAPGARRNRRA